MYEKPPTPSAVDTTWNGRLEIRQFEDFSGIPASYTQVLA
jgi:hypothetical protein